VHAVVPPHGGTIPGDESVSCLPLGPGSRLGREPGDHLILGIVLAFADVLVANVHVLVDQVERRPVEVLVDVLDSVVVVHHDWVLDAKLCDPVLHVLLRMFVPVLGGSGRRRSRGPSPGTSHPNVSRTARCLRS